MRRVSFVRGQRSNPVVRLAAFFVGAGLAACSFGQSDPILRYSFDDGLDPTADSGTLGCPGSIGTGITFVPFGDGMAISLDTLADHVTPTCGENLFDFADGDFSISAVVMTTNAEAEEGSLRFIMTKEHLGSNPGWIMGVRRDNGHARFGISNGTSINIESETSVNDGVPHEILGMRDGNHLYLLIDGICEAIGEIPDDFATTANNPAPMRIGGRAVGSQGPTSGTNDEFIGLIDDVTIHLEAILSCGCPADWNRDCTFNSDDFFAFLSDFTDGNADFDLDGSTTSGDFFAFLAAFSDGC